MCDCIAGSFPPSTSSCAGQTSARYDAAKCDHCGSKAQAFCRVAVGTCRSPVSARLAACRVIAQWCTTSGCTRVASQLAAAPGGAADPAHCTGEAQAFRLGATPSTSRALSARLATCCIITSWRTACFSVASQLAAAPTGGNHQQIPANFTSTAVQAGGILCLCAILCAVLCAFLCAFHTVHWWRAGSGCGG